MDRKRFLTSISLFPLTLAAMKTNDLNNWAINADSTAQMPVLFVGHGSPMNAIQDNEFTRAWKLAGDELPRPRAILCISAHWETRGTLVTAMPQPKTIHDFGGISERTIRSGISSLWKSGIGERNERFGFKN